MACNDHENLTKRQAEVRQELKGLGIPTKAEPASNSTYGEASAVGVYRPSVRQMIDARIDSHNRQANNLYALRRALPEEMSREAESALIQILTDAPLSH